MDLIKEPEFRQWLVDLKNRIRQSQIKAMIKVNDEMLRLYWDLGRDIVIRKMDAIWGSEFYKNLSKELKAEFPDMEGFSKTNLFYMKQFYLFYNQDDTIFQQVVVKTVNTFAQQLVEQIQNTDSKSIRIVQQAVERFETHPVFQIPWGHHILLFTKCKSVHEALFYVQKTIKNGWSRAVLMNFIEAGLYQSQGKSINNFDRLLPDIQSDLAKETLKDPYNFDFLTLTESYKEKELEDALVANITKFLLELGQGFAYIGRQYPIPVGNSQYTLSKLVKI